MTCNSHDVHTFCSLQICHVANPALRHKHTRPRHTPLTYKASQSSGIINMYCVCGSMYALVDVSSLMRHSVTLQGCFISSGESPRASLRPSMRIVIFIACYWDTLLWCKAACQAIIRPGESFFFRPLNIRWDVNKLFLIPGCLLCSVRVHTYV